MTMTMVAEPTEKNSENNKLGDFFSLDSITDKRAFDCKSLPAHSCTTSTTANSSRSALDNHGIPSNVVRSRGGYAARPEMARSKSADRSSTTSLPYAMSYDINNEDTEFSEIDWSRHDEKGTASSKLKNFLGRREPLMCKDRSVVSETRSEAKKVSKILSSDVRNIWAQQSMSKSVADSTAVPVLAPCKNDTDRFQSASRRRSVEQHAPALRGVLRQRSLDTGINDMLVPPETPGVRGLLRHRSMEPEDLKAVRSALVLMNVRGASSVVSSQQAPKCAGRASCRRRLHSQSGSNLAVAGRSSKNDNEDVVRIPDDPERSRQESSQPTQRRLQKSNTGIFTSTVLTDRLWASLDNLNFNPVPDNIARNSHLNDETCLRSTRRIRRGVRRTQSGDGGLIHLPVCKVRRSRSIDVRRASGVERSEALSSVFHGGPRPSIDAFPLVTDPPNNRRCASSDSTRIREFRIDDNSRVQAKASYSREKTRRSKSADARSKSVDVRQRSRSTGRKPQRRDNVNSLDTHHKKRGRSEDCRGSRKATENCARVSGNTNEINPKGAHERTRSKSRSQSARGRSQSISRGKSQSPNESPMQQSDTTSSANSSRKKSTCDVTETSYVSLQSQAFSHEASPSDHGANSSAILRAIAGVRELKISPRKRLHTHLNVDRHHKKAGDCTSSVSGSLASKNSHRSATSQRTLSTASTKTHTELTPGALARIYELGITSEQLALLSKMGLTISERSQQATNVTEEND